jgi:hypothetical protein
MGSDPLISTWLGSNQQPPTGNGAGDGLQREILPQLELQTHPLQQANGHQADLKFGQGLA